MTSVGRPSGVRTASVLLGVITLVPVLVLLLLQRWPNTGDALRTHAVPIYATVGPGTDTTTEPTSVTVTMLNPPAAVAPAWSGTVTATPGAVGAAVRQGDPLVEVDGVAVRAIVSAKPFYRPLVLGDSGPDVIALRSALRAVGQQVEATGAVDATLAAALRSWLGAPGSGVVFSPAQVIWVARADLVIASDAAAIGAPVPAPGAPVITFESLAQQVSVPSAAIPSGVSSASITIAGRSYPVRNGAAELTAHDRAVIGAAAASAASAAPAASSGATGPTGPAGPSVTTLDASLTLHWSARVLSVPTSALLSRRDGSMCVVQRRSAREHGVTGVTVSVAASETATGTSEVTGLAAGASVVLNPLESGSAGACG